MHVLILIIGFITGITLNCIMERISLNIRKSKRAGRISSRSNNSQVYFVSILCSLSFEILFLRFGYTFILAKAMALTTILLIISFIDIRYRIIPDYMVVITLVIGIMFSFITKVPFIDTILGMICGGGILFLISLIPNSMGGGDIKLMFATGAYLGLYRTVWALLLAFVLSSIVSIALILFKIKGTKDYIPFGPFLSIGSFISLLIFI